MISIGQGINITRTTQKNQNGKFIVVNDCSTIAELQCEEDKIPSTFFFPFSPFFLPIIVHFLLRKSSIFVYFVAAMIELMHTFCSKKRTGGDDKSGFLFFGSHLRGIEQSIP